MSGWRRVNLRRLATLGTGHTPSRQKPEYWVDCTTPWLTLADVWQLRDGTKRTVTETSEKISEIGLANSAAVLHPAGTVAMSRTASVGFSCILGVDMATSQDYVTWTCGPNLRPRFLLYALRGLRDEILGMRMGSTHQTIYMPDIERITVPVPPVQVQEHLASFLDVETARIDALIAKKQRVVALVRERSTAFMNRSFGESITYSRVGIPNGLAEHEMVRLGALASVRSGLTLDSGREVGQSSVRRPYLRVANVQDGHLDLQEVKYVDIPTLWSSRFELKRGDVLMTEGGDPDKLGRGTVWRGELEQCLHQNHIFSVRPTSALLPEYLALVTRTAYARLYFEMTASKTTGIASTSSVKISAFRIPLMPVDRQRDIVEKVLAHSSRESSLVYRLEKQIALLREHRQALITAAVTGEMDVPGVSV